MLSYIEEVDKNIPTNTLVTVYLTSAAAEDQKN